MMDTNDDFSINIPISSLLDFPAHIYIKNTQSQYLMCNEHMLAHLGISLDVILAKHLTDFDFPWKDCAKSLQENDNQVMRLRKKEKFYEKVKNANGDLALLVSHKYPRVTEDGEVIGVYGVSFMTTLLNQFAKTKNIISLSTQEQNCLNLLLTGASNKEIGRALNLSYRTVELHITHIKNKFSCKNKLELIIRCIKMGF